jgi:hypothetical protein
MHEAPYWTPRRVRRMGRTACLTVVVLTGSLAAGIAAGVATARYVRPVGSVPRAVGNGSSNSHQPPSGAVVVGFAVALLVFVAMRIGYVLHERRAKPDKAYRTKYERGLTGGEYVGRLVAIELGLAALCCLGVWLRHQFG